MRESFKNHKVQSCCLLLSGVCHTPETRTGCFTPRQCSPSPGVSAAKFTEFIGLHVARDEFMSFCCLSADYRIATLASSTSGPAQSPHDFGRPLGLAHLGTFGIHF